MIACRPRQPACSVQRLLWWAQAQLSRRAFSGSQPCPAPPLCGQRVCCVPRFEWSSSGGLSTPTTSMRASSSRASARTSLCSTSREYEDGDGDFQLLTRTCT